MNKLFVISCSTGYYNKIQSLLLKFTSWPLSKTLWNVELRPCVGMSGSAAQVYLNVSQGIVCINESNTSAAVVCQN